MKQEIDKLMDTYAPSLLRYAERLVRNSHTAQDVVQQVFVRFAGLSSEKQPEDSALKAWLYRATHNQAVDLIRSEQRRKKLHEAHVEQQVLEKTSPSSEDRKRQVLEQLHRLKDQEKQVLLLRLQEGLSYREISEITGLKEGNVGYLLHQAVRNLSEHFNPTGETQ